MSYLQRLFGLIETEGLIGTVRFAKRWLLYKAHYHLYDKKFEYWEVVPTSRGVRAVDLDYDPELRRHSVEYLAAPRKTVREAIERVPKVLSELTFVDIGSGLGRPLLIASEYPFKDVIGYELSPSLHHGALANIDRYSQCQKTLVKPTSVLGNALNVPWPDGSCVFFLFNPFDREFTEQFFERICSCTSPGFEHFLLLLNFKHHDLLKNYPFRVQKMGLIDRVIWRCLSPYPITICHYPSCQEPQRVFSNNPARGL